MTEIFKLEPNKKFPFYTLYTGKRYARSYSSSWDMDFVLN